MKDYNFAEMKIVIAGKTLPNKMITYNGKSNGVIIYHQKDKKFKTDQGATRIVFLFWKWAIKIPNFRLGKKNFLFGMLANMDESFEWSVSDRSGIRDLLCPIVIGSRFGFFLVMKRVDRVLCGCGCDKKLLEESEAFKKLTSDAKEENFVLINGKVVKIDYPEL